MVHLILALIFKQPPEEKVHKESNVLGKLHYTDIYHQMNLKTVPTLDQKPKTTAETGAINQKVLSHFKQLVEPILFSLEDNTIVKYVSVIELLIGVEAGLKKSGNSDYELSRILTHFFNKFFQHTKSKEIFCKWGSVNKLFETIIQNNQVEWIDSVDFDFLGNVIRIFERERRSPSSYTEG